MLKLLQTLIFYRTELLKQLKNETKEQKGRFLGMILGTFRASFLGSILTGKGMLKPGYRHKKGKGIGRAGYGSSIKKKGFHPIF